MYRVCFYFGNSNTAVAAKEFPTLKEATEFANNQPIESVLEIKRYDNKTSDLQD
jgi:hypothetical protein